MRSNLTWSRIIAGCVFIALLAFGFALSQRKLIWNDEIYTQRQSIDARSYMDLLTLRFSEGNKNPLFYVLQKGVCDSFHYRFPENVGNEMVRVTDPRSQVIMRITSNVYMSLALMLIFYFFTFYFSWRVGFYALAVSLSLPLVWMNWVEARPYSLWFLLTTVQLYVACATIIAARSTKAKAYVLAATQVLLVLTTSISILQICIISLCLWCWGYYRKMLVWVVGVSVAVALFYMAMVPVFKIKTFFFWLNLFDAVMPEHLILYSFYAVLVLWFSKVKQKVMGNAFFLVIFLLFLSSACYILFSHLFVKNSQFGFFSRYLIYLVPVDIMMMTFVSYDLVKIVKERWVLTNIYILLGGLLLARALLTYRSIWSSGLYLHTPV